MLQPKNLLRIYVGYDPREHDAYEVAVDSLAEVSAGPLMVVPLLLGRNERWGLIDRPRTRKDGRMWDVISDAPMSTEFAISRFLTPILGQTGWVLFTDCDVLFRRDIAELFALADPQYAVMCVKHNHRPATGKKMDGQLQQAYPRKNWSSVVLYNCDHPANQFLTVDKLRSLPGRDLHAFCWLDDEFIGELPREWNVLVGEQTIPENPGILHYTLGVPSLAGYEESETAEAWWRVYNRIHP